MRRKLQRLALISLGMLFFGSVSAQTWEEVVERISDNGDTIIVKSFSETQIMNTLMIAVKGDTTDTGARKNIKRVYATKPGHLYVSDVTLELDITVPNLHITSHLAPGAKPAIHARSTKVDGTFDKTFFQTPGNLKIDNQYFVFMTLQGTPGEREFVRMQSMGSSAEYDNCVFELTNWTQSLPQDKYINFKYTNCKFLNVGNEASLDKGCMIETRNTPPGEIYIENCTFLNGVNFIQSLEWTSPSFIYMNHNTIVNCAQPVCISPSLPEGIFTNNLFVNTGFIPEYPGFNTWTEDEDLLPKGIIQLDTVEQVWIETYWTDDDGSGNLVNNYPVDGESNRKVIFDKNSASWDARLEGILGQLQSPPEGEWQSQMQIFNSRTQAMFDDDAAYPYLVEGTTLDIEPDFANNQDLVDAWISFAVTNCTPGAPGGGDNVPWWRTNITENIFIPDWPGLADLSYSNATLLAAGLGEVPLGDLNWFPSIKKSWAAAESEYDILKAALAAGQLPTREKIAVGFNDEKAALTDVNVYPNVLATKSVVNYEIKDAANVSIAITNIAGQNVRTIEIGAKTAGSHEIEIERGNLNSGLYFVNVISNNEITGTGKVIVE